MVLYVVWIVPAPGSQKISAALERGVGAIQKGNTREKAFYYDAREAH
jgi:hypothetical protein